MNRMRVFGYEFRRRVCGDRQMRGNTGDVEEIRKPAAITWLPRPRLFRFPTLATTARSRSAMPWTLLSDRRIAV